MFFGFFWLLFVELLAFDFFPTTPPISSFFFSCLPPSLSGVSSVLLCVCVWVCTERLWLSLQLFCFWNGFGCLQAKFIHQFLWVSELQNYSHTTKDWRFRPRAYHLLLFSGAFAARGFAKEVNCLLKQTFSTSVLSRVWTRARARARGKKDDCSIVSVENALKSNKQVCSNSLLLRVSGMMGEWETEGNRVGREAES